MCWVGVHSLETGSVENWLFPNSLIEAGRITEEGGAAGERANERSEELGRGEKREGVKEGVRRRRNITG